MKNLLFTIVLVLVSFTSNASEKNPIEWNNNGTHKQVTVKVGDTVKIKDCCNASKYVSEGVVTAISSKDWVKINGYFVKVTDIELITKYNTVK
jgi:ribosomal protein S17